MTSNLKLRTSPSVIANVMESGCQRALFFHSISEGTASNKAFLKTHYDIDIDSIERSTVVKNQFRRDAGNELEQDILNDRNIPEDLGIVTYGVRGHCYTNGTSNTDRFGEDETRDILAGLEDIDAFEKTIGIDDLRYIYQLTLIPTAAFKKEYGFDEMFDLNWSNPDLIMLTKQDDGIHLSLIDIKMAQHVRLRQKIQVTLYALLLESMVRELGNTRDMSHIHVDTKTGYIWHRGKAAPTPFDMEEVLPHVKSYLSDDVSKLTGLIRSRCVSGPCEPSDIPALLSHRLCRSCEYCDYFGYCLNAAREADDFQLTPYLSSYGARCLEELYAKNTGVPCATISYGNIKNLISGIMSDPSSEDLADSIRSTPALREFIKYERSDELIIRDRAVSDFPVTTVSTVSIYLTAQKDEITERFFALAYSYHISKDKAPKGLELNASNIYIARSDKDFDRIENEFIEGLHSLFTAIDDHNGSLSDGAEPLRLQCYVMDPYESDNLMELMYDMITRTDEIHAEMLLDLLSWFQDEKLAKSDTSSRDIPCDFPFVSLTDTVRRMFILPTEIAYSLDDISRFFVKGKPFEKNIRWFSNHFGNSISAGFIREYWKDPANEKYDIHKLEKEIQVRLLHYSLIREGIQTRLMSQGTAVGRKYLLSYAPEFRLPDRNRYRHTLLSRFDFQVRYEEMLKRLDTRNTRLKDVEDLLADNVISQVTLQNIDQIQSTDYWGNPITLLRHNFLIENYSDETVIPDIGLTFAPTEPGKLQEFRDSNIVYDNNYWGTFDRGRDFSVQADGSTLLHLTLEESTSSFFNRMSAYYYMFERYTDWTSPYIVGGRIMRSNFAGVLSDIDNGELCEDVISLLVDPCSFVRKVEDERKMTAAQSLDYEKKYFQYPFVSSQREAFLQLCNQNLSLVQGPPGTGKTNFIAMAILIYLISRMEQNEPAQRIYITSNSHVAIENVLLKIAELLDGIQKKDLGFSIPLTIYNVDGSLENDERITSISKDSIAGKYGNSIFDNPDNIILGATVWALEKTYQRGFLNKTALAFDMVIVDEASQVRLVDSTIAIAHLQRDGKLLLVGDHEQLPPIIQGKYDRNEDTPFTAGSVFQYFIDHDLLYRNDHGMMLYTKRLNEQFRMNGILSLYPSVQIYEGDYKPANDHVATQKLSLPPCGDDDICEWIMNPDYPFVLCDIRGTGGGSFIDAEAKKAFETELVTKLTDYCIHNLTDDSGNLYDDPESFWRNGMFIISPHHAHINRLRAAVNELTRDELPGDNAAFGEHAFIDTVDKMQGQETDVAIVSYGISDENQAVREKDFVFNRNRLNVSITRGKKKMVLILTDILTDKQLELLAEEDQRLIDGISFVNSIKTFAASGDTESSIPTVSEMKSFQTGYSGIHVDIYRKSLA